MDDIIVFSPRFEQHLADIEAIFQRLQAYGLKLKPKKCTFCKPSVNYLGHVISKSGLEPDPTKIAAVKDYPTPKTQTEVRQFLGLASYYRRFVPNFSKHAAPLNTLIKKDTSFEWTSDCQHAFNTLKHSLITAPVLAFPDFKQPFLLQTDACTHGIGGVLAQRINNIEKPVAYASRTLSKAERNYSIIELEALAVVYFIVLFRPYLLGHMFTVQTDHAPLRWLLTANHRNNRLARFSLKLQEFANLMTIDYRPGRANTNADALSRSPINFVGTITDTETLAAKAFISAQKEDPNLAEMIDYLENATLPTDTEQIHIVLKYADQYLMRNNCLHHIYQPANRTYPILQKVVPFNMRLKILEAYHDDLHGGEHLGIRKTAQKIMTAYY